MAIRRGVKVDQRGAFGVLPHPSHELPEVSARIGGELIAGVPQVVEVNVFKTYSGQRGKPDTPPEVRMRKRRSCRAAEHERGRKRNPPQVLPQVKIDQLRERDDAGTGLGLGRAELVTLFVVVELT